MLAQSKFSHKQLIGKSNNEKQEMLFKEFGINWNNLPQYRKSGHALVKVFDESVQRNKWQLVSAPSTREEIDIEIKKVLAPKET